jgi:predicted amidohydrolase YtcJ
MVNGKVGSKVRGDSVADDAQQVSRAREGSGPGLAGLGAHGGLSGSAELSKLTTKDLDALAPNNPLMLALSSSEGIVNTQMLERAFAAGPAA